MLKSKDSYLNESAYERAVFSHYSTRFDYVIDPLSRTFVRFITGNSNTPEQSRDIKSMTIITKSGAGRNYGADDVKRIVPFIEKILANPDWGAVVPSLGTWSGTLSSLTSSAPRTSNDFIVMSPTTYNSGRVVHGEKHGLVYLARLLEAFKALLNWDFSKLDFNEYSLHGFTFIPFTWPGASHREVSSLYGLTIDDPEEVHVSLRIGTGVLCTGKARDGDINGIQAMRRLLSHVGQKIESLSNLPHGHDEVIRPAASAGRQNFSEYIRITKIDKASDDTDVNPNVARVIINCDQICQASKVIYFSTEETVEAITDALNKFEKVVAYPPELPSDF